MDKRWYRRDSLSIGVVVYCDGLLVARGFTENLGPGGAYVRLHGLTLMPDSFLELEFRIQRPGVGTLFRFPAKVVHSSRRGAGVMFEDFDRLVLEIVYASRQTTQSNAAATPVDDVLPAAADTEPGIFPNANLFASSTRGNRLSTA